jgi:DNA-directed RNA polymerase subunit RPC12/RpoP
MGQYICDICSESFPDDEVWPARVDRERVLACEDCRPAGSEITL